MDLREAPASRAESLSTAGDRIVRGLASGEDGPLTPGPSPIPSPQPGEGRNADGASGGEMSLSRDRSRNCSPLSRSGGGDGRGGQGVRGLRQPGDHVDLGLERPVDRTLVRDLQEPRALLVGQGTQDLDDPVDAVDPALLRLAAGAVDGVDLPVAQAHAHAFERYALVL